MGKTLLTMGFGFVLAAVLFITTSVLIAWTGPSAAPPSNNVSAPINVGTTDQVKNGGFGMNALAVFGNAFISGASRYINFGTTTSSGSAGYGIRDNNGVIEFKNSGGSWVPIPTSGGSGGSGTSFTISSNATNVNLYVLAGSPSTAGNYTITINPGVAVGSTDTVTPALRSGTWPAGSTVTLINNGMILGKGGDGGAAGYYTCGTWTCGNPAGGTGTDGGPAMSLSYNLTINNTNGIIGGGGGGGGGGGSNSAGSYGGTGGGGQGSIDSSGANPGTATAAGAGGTGPYGARGGNGGSLGVAGASGATSGSTNGGGGAPGVAITLNGKTITWLGGNDSTHVKGAVQ